MTAHALAIPFAAPPAAVFRHLADVENFPRWAEDYCERLELARGRWLAFTRAGDVTVELTADERTGVIDLWLGDETRCTAFLPLRVVAWPGGGTVVCAVLCPAPEQGEFAFAQQCEAFAAALRRLALRLAVSPAEVAV